MNTGDLKPASTFAQNFGVKCLAYGGPGSGKTPAINTAPRPVMLAVEPGLASMRGSTVPTFAAFNDAKKIAEFFEWCMKSNETKNFDTICIDSMSELATIVLQDQEKKSKDKRQQYGELARIVTNYAYDLYYLKYKHIFMIAKQGQFDEMGSIRYRPIFPGQVLNSQIPHMYDEVLHFDKAATIPGVIGPRRAIRTQGDFLIEARDRTGILDQFEPQDLGALFAKIMNATK